MAGSIYSTVFGGNVVAPALPTYLALSISANVVLGWPLESNITAPAAAEIIDVTATAPGLTIQLSDARQVGTGYCALFNNVGANSFTLLDAQGNTLMAPAPGQAWQIYISDNSTLQGTWRVFQYGASVSTANAATLAGSGLKAISTTLNERIVINQQAVNYTILTTDRASCIEWTGGSGGVFTPPTPGVAGADWFCYVKNAGTGVLTLSGTIDGSVGKTFNPNDSCILVSDGTNLFTMGFGQSIASSFNFVTISLAGLGPGTTVLSGAQLNRISYKFTGALAGNLVVQVPGSIQQYWVDNETTGAFTLTISTGAGATVAVSQATRVILYSDGLNIVNAVSSGAGSITLVADGTAAAPGLAWASDTSMGFYRVGPSVLGFSTAGVARGSINASGQWTINAPSSGIALSVATANVGAANSGNGLFATGGNIVGTVVEIKTTMPGIDSLCTGVEQATGCYIGVGGQLQFRTGGFTAAQNHFVIAGAGGVSGFGPTAAALVDMTPDTGTFTVTYNGGISAPTGTATWVRSGKQITLTLPFLTATSNSTAFFYSGLPAALQPATLTQAVALGSVLNNSVGEAGGVAVLTPGSGNISFARGTAGINGWTNAGSKNIGGVGAPITFPYLLS